MAKRDSRGYSKKLYKNLKRLSKPGGKKVWLYMGEEFETLGEVHGRYLKTLRKSKDEPKTEEESLTESE